MKLQQRYLLQRQPTILHSVFIIMFSFVKGSWGDDGSGHDDLLLNGKKLL